MHKKFFERMVDGASTEVVVRQPAARTAATSAVDKVRGTREESAVTSYGIQQSINAIVSSPDQVITNTTWGPALAQALGGTDVFDLVLRCKLTDVLSDPDEPLGRTIFHSAKDVVYQGQSFKVTGVDRTGMAPLDAYVVWVGLKKIGEA